MITIKKTYVIGIDIGGTKIALCLANMNGEIIENVTVSSRTDNMIHLLLQQITDLCHNNRLSLDDIQTVGIGIPGIFNPVSNSSVEAVNIDFANKNFVNELQQQLGCTVIADNDVKVASLAIKKHYIGSIHNFIYVSLGTGIGASIVINGHILYGDSYDAGELGHIRVEMNGRPCSCGGKGCLEAIASGKSIANTYKQLLHDGEQSILPHDTSQMIENITTKQIVEAWYEKDELATAVMTEACQYIGTALANLMNITGIHKIYVGGGLSRVGDKMFSIFEQQKNEIVLPHKRDNTEVIPSPFYENTGLVGAVALACTGTPLHDHS